MYLLGLDLGSSSVKASLVSASTGATIASTLIFIPMLILCGQHRKE